MSALAADVERVHLSENGPDPIGDFYTRHPYPPPVDNLDRARDQWRGREQDVSEFHLLWPRRAYRADLDVLVAGCGTWQAAKYALCHPAARVVGIDVSETSIHHTDALRQKYGLKNLSLSRLPIEAATELEDRFDLVVCTGVLHHLADPGAGLRALRSVLRTEGAMYVMVYAPYGRLGVSLLQDYCRRLRVAASDDEMRDLSATLNALSADHPLSSVLRGARDAMHHDALADALLNPRERSYSVPQFFDFIQQNGMELSRWYWQAPYLPSCGAIAKTPHAARLMALPPHEQFAAMELWRGTMTSQSAILHRSDAGTSHESVRFDGDEWRGYVPVRLPWTHLVQERLPGGASGVLLNRAHQFRDLIVVLDARDRGLFDAIDGRRTIAEIADRAGNAGGDAIAGEIQETGGSSSPSKTPSDTDFLRYYP